MDENTHPKKLELKRRAVEYYQDNQVPKQLEGLLNRMFFDQPRDLYGYMSLYFERLSKPPTISKINTWKSLSSSGHETLTATVWCCIKGQVKPVCDFQSFVYHQPILRPVASSTSRPANTNRPPANSKRDSKIKVSKKDVPLEESRNIVKISSGLPPFHFHKYQDLLNDRFLREVSHVEVTSQKAIDQKLSTLTSEIVERLNVSVDAILTTEENAEQTTNQNSGVEQTTNQNGGVVKHHREVEMACWFTSALCAVTSAQLKEQPLYESLAESSEEDRKYSIPLPALPILTCDSDSPGKLNIFKEILIVPKIHSELFESCELISGFTSSLQENLVAKFGSVGSVRNDKGIFTPSFDKIEQVFDLFTTSQINQDFEFSEKFDLVVNIGASDLYDEDKKRYEVCSGQFKSTEDLIEMYNTWLDQYPIICLIDGLSEKDDQSLLFNELSHRCFVCVSESSVEVDDTQQSSTEVDNRQQSSLEVENENKILKPFEDGKCNAVVLCPENVAYTISDISRIASIIKERHSGVVMLAENWENIFNASFFVDLAIALDVSFIRASSIYTGGLATIQRLISVHSKLESNDMLLKRNSYAFTVKVPNNESSEHVPEETVEGN